MCVEELTTLLSAAYGKKLGLPKWCSEQTHRYFAMDPIQPLYFYFVIPLVSNERSLSSMSAGRVPLSRCYLVSLKLNVLKHFILPILAIKVCFLSVAGLKPKQRIGSISRNWTTSSLNHPENRRDRLLGNPWVREDANFLPELLCWYISSLEAEYFNNVSSCMLPEGEFWLLA